MQIPDDFLDTATENNLPVEIIGRRVHCKRDMYRWERSEAMADIVAFVDRMNLAAKRQGSRRVNASSRPQNVNRTMEVLRRVGDWAEEHEPTRNDFTVGPRFRRFHELLHAEGHGLLVRTYRSSRPGDHRTVELPVYLENSFGDPDAMAYGPEHELSFCMFLVALFKLRHLDCADEPYVVAVLFDRYLDVVDYLIGRYRLRPSTEYGNWALNDYRYVAFVWGSAQLAGAEDAPSPAAAVLDEEAASRLGDAFVFMKCVDAVHRWANDLDEPDENGDEEVDKGDERKRRRRRPVWSHSYQLWNVTGLARWDRVNECLTSAFRRDVLGRFEIVSRLAFGELLKFTPNPRPPGVPFYDCIPPAEYVARQEPAVATEVPAALDRAMTVTADCYEDEMAEGVETFGTEVISLHEATEEFVE